MADALNPNSSHQAKRSNPTAPKDTGIPVAYLHECFSYNAETGKLTWKRRPLVHFDGDERLWKIWNTRYAGTLAGGIGGGYLRVNLIVGGRGRLVRAHRIAYAAHQWPGGRLIGWTIRTASQLPTRSGTCA